MSQAKTVDDRAMPTRDDGYLSWNQISFQLMKLIRLYTFNSPIRRGKLRLSRLGMRLSKRAPEEMLMSTCDGRRLYIELSDGIGERLFFLGEYERAVTEVVCRVVERGDTCFDAGANVGWYTTLLGKLGAEVHAFEPSPNVFAVLKENVGLLENAPNIFINNLALGETHGRVVLHVFPDLPHGHTSLSTMGRADYSTVEAEMVTLDSYLKEKSMRQVDFIKVDIEGAELMFLRGASKLFDQKVPPIFMVEMALGTTKGFAYFPNDLIVFLRERADYEFYAVDEQAATLHQVDRFAPCHIGANVLCLPARHYGDKVSRAKDRIESMIAA